MAESTETTDKSAAEKSEKRARFSVRDHYVVDSKGGGRYASFGAEEGATSVCARCNEDHDVAKFFVWQDGKPPKA